MAEDKSGDGRPVKVLQVCAVDFTVRQFLAPLALHLQNEGCEVHVACTPGPYWEELQAMGLDMRAVPVSRNLNVLSHLVSLARLRGLMLREQYDIVHCHTPIAGLLGRVAAWLTQRPVRIYTAHGFYFHEGMRGLRRVFATRLEEVGAWFQNCLFCVSREDARTAELRRIEHPSRIYTVGNGVDPQKFHPVFAAGEPSQTRAEVGIPADATVITIVGRVTREKGFFEFFDAARRLASDYPGVHFLVVGDTLQSDRDRIRAKLARLAEADGLEGRVHLVGMRPDVARLLAASTIFCLPSHREGMPTSVIEAMMMELPVVATRIRGCREAVVDGQTGFLVKVGDATELAGALGYLLDHPEIARQMGRAGRRRAADQFALKEVLERQWNIYIELLRERGLR